MTTTTTRGLRLAAALYVLALAAVSLLPSGAGPMKGWDASFTPAAQDVLHLPAYFVLTVLVSTAWPRRAAGTRPPLGLLALGCTAFGVAMELGQAIVPGRTCSPKDMLTNGVGVALAWGTLLVWHRTRGTARHATAEFPAADVLERRRPMIEGRTILCFASGYDAPPTSKHHVMHLLAEKNVVLWVNYHASRAPTVTSSDMRYMARKAGQILRGMVSPRRNLHVLTPPVVPLPGRAWAKRLNRFLLVRSIRRALRKIGNGPLQIWSFTPDIAYLLDSFDAEKVVYYCVDDFASFSGYDRDQVRRDEEDLCRRADLVVAPSTTLQEAKEPFNTNTLVVTHGVAYEHFSRAVREALPVPEDVKDIPRPILGFFGLIRDWVNLDLLADVARARPDWHLVLLGNAAVDLASYRHIPNMHFLGHRPYESLPAYCRCFDVGLVPFRVSELTCVCNPIKATEYLAAGLPVVATPLHHIQSAGSLVFVGDEPAAFVQAVEQALTISRERRLEQSRFMEAETWEHKLNLIANRLASQATRQA